MYPMQYKFVVFDWDGTLMDSVARIVACMRAAISDTGLPHRKDEELTNIIGLGLQEAVAQIYPDISSHDFDKLVENYRHHFLFRNKTPSLLFEGAESLLAHLQQSGFYLGVATGKGRAGLDKVLDETGLHTSFHATRCADEAFSKPHPQMLQDLMDEMGMQPHETLMVGDTEYDLQMAHNAGCDCIAITHGVHSHERLKIFNPVAFVDNLPMLQTWFQNSQSQAAND